MLKSGDMRELLVRSANMVRPLMQEKGLALRLDLSPYPTAAVCDHDKMIQVMTNLLGNAIKFTPAGSTIMIKSAMATSGESLQVSVIDEGVWAFPKRKKK